MLLETLHTRAKGFENATIFWHFVLYQHRSDHTFHNFLFLFDWSPYAVCNLKFPVVYETMFHNRPLGYLSALLVANIYKEKLGLGETNVPLKVHDTKKSDYKTMEKSTADDLLSGQIMN